MVFRGSNVCCVLVMIVNIFKLSKSEMEGRIVGGAYAVRKQFPHAVFLEASCTGDEWVCGSSVLNQNILLTAAHCIQGCSSNNKKDIIDAFGGSEDYSTKAVVVRRVDSILLHAKYDEVQVVHDIGLAVVKNNFPLNEYMKRVIIPCRFPSATKGTVAGWGLTDEEKEESSSRLKFVETQLIPRERCQISGSLGPGMICAGSADGSEDHPSSGDSGSALVVPPCIQIGLVSFMDKTNPTFMVYTNVTYYYNWIMDNSKILYCGDG